MQAEYRMNRGFLYLLLLLAACLVAGVYGAIHNQISYTVAPDYFHSFKFQQFDIPRDLHNRLGAALVGWYASWWMGLIIGVPVLLVALILPDGRAYWTRSLVAFGVVALTALIFGLVALVQASDKRAFSRAGEMHDASYLGGCIGILTASIYLIVARVRLGRT